MIATILTTKCRERRNLVIIQPDKNPDIVSGSDQELRTMPTPTEHKTVHPPSPKRYGGTCRGKFFDHEEKLECDLILIDSTQKKEAYHD